MVDVPRVSVGLPVYNGERYLVEAIDSLLGQTYEDFELIISDNASTDRTEEICRSYQDSRIRYFRQARNIGLSPNHNFVIRQSRGEFFKCAHYDDRCAPLLLERCVDALVDNPDAVLAYTASATINEDGIIQGPIHYTGSAAIPRTPARFWRMLVDGWGDYYGGVVRLGALRRTAPHASYHFADRVFLTELGLYGTFFMVPECLHFRRHHSEQAGRRSDMRERCAILDPRRGDRVRHPAIRLYGEYPLGFARAIHNSPLSPSERRECYVALAKWSSTRLFPVADRILRKRGLVAEERCPGGRV